ARRGRRAVPPREVGPNGPRQQRRSCGGGGQGARGDRRDLQALQRAGLGPAAVFSWPRSDRSPGRRSGARGADPPRGEDSMLDLVVTGGLVRDGTGTPAVPADVAVAGGRIVEVGRLAGVRAARVIRADERIVSPGFIDMHAHDDFNLPVNPLAAEKTRQGVT